MKSALLFFLLAASTLVALIAENFFPPLSLLKNAHILLIPVFFTYGALVLPFPAMIGLAVFTGLITDLSNLQVVDGKIEMGLGWSIFVYTILGTMMHSLRRTFLSGAWWIHPPLSAFCTFLLLALQYLTITLQRGNMIFNEIVAWKILAPAAIAFLVSPLIEIFFIFIERAFPLHRSPP